MPSQLSTAVRQRDTEPEFYIGYERHAPPGLARRMRTSAVVGIALAGVVAGLLVIGQSPFDPSSFEFLASREHAGLFSAGPYPVLTTAAEGGFLLVGPGKHGLDPGMAARFDGRLVQLSGALATHGEQRLLEVDPGSLQPAPARSGIAPSVSTTRLGAARFAGEIVDTKCYLGVMNPGRGKVHRSCAARCLSGGIPPGLLVRDAGGHARVLLLAGVEQRALTPYVGEPVVVRGEVVRAGTQWILETSLQDIQRE